MTRKKKAPAQTDIRRPRRIRMRSGSTPLAAYAHLARELDEPDLDAREIPQFSNATLRWRCGQCNERFSQVVANRTRFNQGCPYCSGRRRRPGELGNSLAVKFPELAAQWHPTLNGDLTPWDVAPYSATKRWWCTPELPARCWEATPASRVATPGDPFSRGLRADTLNSLRATHPDIAIQFVEPVECSTDSPDTVTAGCNRMMRWRCSSNPTHTWEARVYARASGRFTGCPTCAAKRSREELACFEALAQHLPGLIYGDRDGAAQLIADCWPRPVDALLPSAGSRKTLVLEYDGAFWHAEKSREDRIKATTFRRRGYRVVRIRRAPLDPLHNDDIQVPPDVDPARDAAMVFRHLMQINALGEPGSAESAMP